MLLDSFFLRYKADTGQAVKDVNALDAAEAKRSRNKKKNESDEDKTTAKKKKGGKEGIDETKKASKAQEELGKAGKQSFDSMLSGGGKFGELLGKLGPMGIAAAVGVAAIAGAVSIAVAGIEDAREAAKEAVELGDKAYEARLNQGELIRAQNIGRTRGLSDEETSKSAKGVYDKGAEIRAAQRQAARDPASGFNNPLIKQGNLFKKAGVDVSAALGTQIEQQDKYLRALVASGEQERALVEGVELFGRSLHDVRSVLATTAEASETSALTMAQENNRRRDLQKSSENLATAEGKLEAARKKNDERVLSKTVPATEGFTKALTEWEEAIAPLKDVWGDFVAGLIEGLTSLVNMGKDAANFFTWGSNNHTKQESKDREVTAAGDKAVEQLRMDATVQGGRGNRPSAEAEAAARKTAEEAKGKEFEANFADSEKTRKAGITEQVNKAVDTLVTKKDGKQLFEGREVSQSDIDTAKSKASAAAEKDPNVDLQKETNDILRDLLNQTAESGKVQEAQTNLTKKIESNTTPLVNTGLEQAMALWAGGMGKGGGLDSVNFKGEDRASYQDRVNQMRRTINPNTVSNVSEARNTANAVGQQASSLNKASGPSGGQGNKSVTTGPINVTVTSNAQDGASLGKAAGQSLAAEFSQATANLLDGRVS